MFEWAAAATVRRRRPILLAGAGLAVCPAIVTASAPTSIAVPAVTGLLTILAGVAGPRRPAPAAFDVRAGAAAFTAPVRAWPVYFALCLLAFAGGRLGTVAGSVRAEGWAPADMVLAGSYVLFASLVVVHAWRGYDVSLRPDGLYDRRSLGTVIVPWEAVPVASAARRPRRPSTVVFPPGAFAAHDAEPAGSPGEVRLGYVRPEYVRRRGLVRDTRRIRTGNVDARFLTAAIRFYAAHPEQRARIGTEAGYRHLREAVGRSGR